MLDPHVVRKIAELDEVMPFARIEHDPDHDAAALGSVERVDDDRLRERSGREVRMATAALVRRSAMRDFVSDWRPAMIGNKLQRSCVNGDWRAA